MYNKIVDALKSIARDALRMKIVVRLQSELASIVSEINGINDDILETKKDIARTQFKTTQIVDTDPDKESKLKNLSETEASLNEDINAQEKLRTSYEEQKANKEAEIVKVEAGEVKVNLEALNELTKELIMEVTKDTAVKKVAELSA